MKLPSAYRPEHVKTHDQLRGTTAERGYDQSWVDLRAYKISRDPICEVCQHYDAKFPVEVHHINAIRDRPDLRLEYANLKTVCRACHQAIEQAKRVA